MIQFARASESDRLDLAEVSRRAFDDDVKYGKPNGPGGPPGYDSPEWQARATSHASAYYKIVSDGKIAGGIIVFDKGEGHYYLGRIFLEPSLQNRGIGRLACEFLWKEYPEARLWSLETPFWNRRTQHFYEKLGFVMVGVDSDGCHYEMRLAGAV